MNLSQEEWWANAQADSDAVILDVRTADEHSRGIIPGSENIDIYRGQGFIDEVEKMVKDKKYYVYCAAGARSGQACSIMNQLGFKHAFNLTGGISQWRGPVEMP